MKTKESRRQLALFPTAEECFRKIKLEQDENRKLYKRSYQNKDGYVFCWEDGHLYDPNYISALFKKAITEFGRPELTLHKLRHTCCSLLIEKGWDIKKVQHWLGHEDIETTLNIYAHYTKSKNNQEYDDLEEISSSASAFFKN